jgi:hypothetical protein
LQQCWLKPSPQKLLWFTDGTGAGTGLDGVSPGAVIISMLTFVVILTLMLPMQTWMLCKIVSYLC